MSFDVYAPSFLERFLESHAVMLQGNAGLKPKEGEVTSRPWQWPINYRVGYNCASKFHTEFVKIFILKLSHCACVSQGQFFSGQPHRIYLLGNPIIWWGNILFFFSFILVFISSAVYEQRGITLPDPSFEGNLTLISRIFQTHLEACIHSIY